MNYNEKNNELFNKLKNEPFIEKEIYLLNKNLIYHVLVKLNILQSSFDYEDVFMEGSIGLIKAIRSFSLDKGSSFYTYAVICISNEIGMYFRKNKKYKLNETSEFCGKEEVSIFDFIADDFLLESYYIQQEDNKEESDKIKMILTKLDQKELLILNMYYGLNGYTRQNMSYISDLIGCSLSYCSRKIKRILNKIKAVYENPMIIIVSNNLFMCARHGINLTSESLVAGIYRQA